MAHDLTQAQIATRVEEIISAHIGGETITPDSDLINDLAMDSLELVELGLKLEKAFGLKLPIAEIRRCVVVDDVIQLVWRLSQEIHLETVENA